MTKSKGIRVTLPRYIKLAICMHYEEKRAKGETITQKDLALWTQIEFQLPAPPGRSTIQDILRSADDWYALDEERLMRKRDRSADVEVVDLHLLAVLEYCELEAIPMSGTSVLITAKRMARDLHFRLQVEKVPSFSPGWLFRFMERHEVETVRLHGEQAATDFADAEACMDNLRVTIGRFELHNVYNIDEAAYNYRASPRTTLVRIKRDSKGKKITRKGGKVLKERLTLLVGSNADGSDKLPFVALGLSKSPRCISSNQVQGNRRQERHEWRRVNDTWEHEDVHLPFHRLWDMIRSTTNS